MAVAAIAVGSIGSLLRGSGDTESISEPPLGDGTRLIASWARDYESIGEMLAEPNTVAIEGNVVAAGPAFPVGDGVLFTESLVEVIDVFAGSPRLDSADENVIRVRQTGGFNGNYTQEVEGVRLLDVGEHVLLFATFDPTFGVYFVTGGAHGHFTIDNGVLEHANLADPDGPLAARHGGVHPLANVFAGMNIEAAATRIRDAASSTSD